MNCGCNYGGCGYTNPFGCNGCNMGCGSSGISSFGCMSSNGGSWFAIVLVVFLLLIICGNSRIRP